MTRTNNATNSVGTEPVASGDETTQNTGPQVEAPTATKQEEEISDDDIAVLFDIGSRRTDIHERHQARIERLVVLGFAAVDADDKFVAYCLTKKGETLLSARGAYMNES